MTYRSLDRGSIHMTVDGATATIVIDAPPRRNALTLSDVVALRDALIAAADDYRARVVVLSAHGPVFSAGGALDGGDTSTYADRWIDLIGEVHRCRLPVIARVEGDVYGIAVALVAIADLSIIADDVTLAVPEVRVGMPPSLVAAVCAAKLCPADARDLLLTGRTIDGAEAARMRLVTRSVARKDVEETVQRLVDQLTAGAPTAQAVCKGLLADIADSVSADALNLALAAAEQGDQREASEGLTAFRERRAPRWLQPPQDEP